MNTITIYNQSGMNLLQETQSNLFAGFEYFSGATTRDNSNHLQEGQNAPIYFLSFEGQQVVGVLKLSHEITNEIDNSGFYAKYHMVAYVDVHENFRKQGIAKKLYNQLNEWGKNVKPSHEPIVGTPMSESGQNANVHKLRKDILKDTQNFDNEKQLYAYLSEVISLDKLTMQTA